MTQTEQFLISEAQERIAEREAEGFGVLAIERGPLVKVGPYGRDRRTLLVVFEDHKHCAYTEGNGYD